MPETSRKRVALQVLFAASLALAACKGCDDSVAGGLPAQARAEASALERARARMAELKLDPNQHHAEAADGAIDCKSDARCFVAQADRCAPAWFEHVDKQVALGLAQLVHARYRVLGLHKGQCRMLRQVDQASVVLAPAARDMLLEQGKSTAEIDAMLAQIEAALRAKHLPRIGCNYSSSQMLELALDLNARRYNVQHFRDACRPIALTAEWPLGFASKPAANDASVPSPTPKQPRAPSDVLPQAQDDGELELP